MIIHISVLSSLRKHFLLFLPRYIIDQSERKTEVYPCQQDEWARITFADYSVPLPDTPNTWVILFRLETIDV